jgi:hypothetical protein
METPVFTELYDTDSDPATVSDAERRLIIAVRRAVAQYFAIWECDVTTGELLQGLASKAYRGALPYHMVHMLHFGI